MILNRVESTAIKHVSFYFNYHRLRSVRPYSSTPNDKLRILFCGTDAFSIESLQALHNESNKTDQVQSIEIVTRKDKLTGRGHKTLTPPPIKQTAIDLNLPVHQIDTFKGWTPPDINLIIAVSFGLLIPQRILNASKYGGLNVHPSLLPDLRGAAPTQWAIILGRQHTGVSLQTLHPTKFDAGVVLDQTIPVPLDATSTESALSAKLAPLGAELLIKAIRNGLYLPPYHPILNLQQEVAFAPKIKTEHTGMDFEYGRHELCQRNRALGPLYAFTEDRNGKKLRVKFGPIYTAISNSQLMNETRDLSKEQARLRSEIPVGVPYAFVERNQIVTNCPNGLYVNTKDGTIYISEVIVEGKSTGPAVQRSAQSKLFGPPRSLDGANEGDHGSVFYQYLKPLNLD